MELRRQAWQVAEDLNGDGEITFSDSTSAEVFSQWLAVEVIVWPR